MQATEDIKVLKEKCKHCEIEYEIKIDYTYEINKARHILIKTPKGKCSDNVIFIENKSMHAAVKCPNCNKYNKINIDNK